MWSPTLKVKNAILHMWTPRGRLGAGEHMFLQGIAARAFLAWSRDLEKQKNDPRELPNLFPHVWTSLIKPMLVTANMRSGNPRRDVF